MSPQENLEAKARHPDLPTVAICATLAAFGPTMTTAESVLLTGNQLYAMCNVNAEAEPVSFAFCTGYVIGYVEGRNWGTFTAVSRLLEPESAAEGNKIGNALVGHCVPEDANYEQLIDVVVGYMQRHPESRHESARALIWLSYIEAFPCE